MERQQFATRQTFLLERHLVPEDFVAIQQCHLFLIVNVNATDGRTSLLQLEHHLVFLCIDPDVHQVEPDGDGYSPEEAYEYTIRIPTPETW